MGHSDQQINPDRYHVVPRTLSFITHGEDILLLKGAPTKRIWPNKYNGVGGHLEPNEDLYSAAIREIREETGLEVNDLRLRGTINIPVDVGENQGILVFVFTAVAASRALHASPEGIPEWVNRQRVAEIAAQGDLVEDLPTLLPRLLAMPPDALPFSATYEYDADDRLIITFG